ncbi:putative virulence factor [Rhodospirillum rubrum]|uniref:Conserved virulence factor protein n=1 Tax=Rhodospirillum rubrum (strain ATCC 11170 / ATH 1.1.1 / DSM 467 / LMG 4362 / NCIMB 8255 / S1) TaxID=269796 RepID=Q2RPJ7_RHORT|nr:putative virulence factor [Rhodospirillum rubrum]ABC23948.1 conserved virulence factor protein [Rhodospirillum rubrum ATCC 11170]AEO49693.1 virulence factor protein [Rhodospirillum rubrum F11]MBK5955608.1 virulence factor [Rhodospirillum rubrum]HCF17885.1 virulence factor [Rhodospirillum rubrum]
MADTTKDLGRAIDALDKGAEKARLWIDALRESAPSVSLQAESLSNAARRARLACKRLAHAADRNNCVGVFGPSQAGKSYLVSALARTKGGRLTIRLGAESRDFLREINPPGDRESTGLVTRFTIHANDIDPAYPVELRLLSETDVVKILANSFFQDFDPNSMTIAPLEEDDIRAALREAAAAATAKPAAHLTEIALFELDEYFHQNFKKRIGALDRADFWAGLIRHGGRLPIAARARLFSVLWGRVEAFTKLYIHLAGALEAIGNPEEARAAISGLIPREIGSPPRANSIIDVAVLNRLGTSEDGSDPIALLPVVAGKSGAPVSLPRATLTALIAEVRLVIEHQPWPFFEHTDLLDFPGARSRLKLLQMPKEAEEEARQTRELYLRGKIAYLFQRYTDELELTSMLLCMPPSVAEVKDLAMMVRSWINVTHGETPAKRKAVRNALFLVLTKHDLEFLEKGGETPDSRAGKWDRRLHASLLELYGKDDWPGDWDGKPFDNTVFLRNPSMKQVHLMRYRDEATLDEEGPVDSPVFREYRDAFLASADVARHFADKTAVWDAAMTANDGGVAYLVDRLVAVLDPGLKRHQASERLATTARALEEPLRAFHYAEGDEAKRAKDAALVDLRRRLFSQIRESDHRSFAALLAGLMADPAQVRGLYMNVAEMREDELNEIADGAVADEPVVEDDDDPWAEAGADPVPAKKAAPPRRKDRPEVFASQVMNQWAGGLRAFQRNEVALAVLGLSAATVGPIIDEMLVGANRLGLQERIAEAAREETRAVGTRWSSVADRVTGIAANTINDFVAYLDYAALPVDQRPGVPEPPKERKRGIFTTASLKHPGPVLGDEPEEIEKAFFLDWGVALRAFGCDNVGHAAGREISDEKNRELGAILDMIDVSWLVAAE